MGGAFSDEGWDDLYKEEESLENAEKEATLLERLYNLENIESENGQELYQYLVKKIRALGSDAE